VEEENSIFHGVDKNDEMVIDWGSKFCTDEMKEPDWRATMVCKNHVNNVHDVNWGEPKQNLFIRESHSKNEEILV
jgi:hypothetical protein